MTGSATLSNGGYSALVALNLGLIYALATYLMWGGVVIYWKQLSSIPPDQILCFRVICSLPVLIPIIKCSGLWPQFKLALRSTNDIKAASVGAILISINWLLFIWGVADGQIIQLSLGYFICPLAAVMFGVIFFHERLRLMQKLAFALASFGVLYQASMIGQIPWLSLGVALSFALYAVSRKASKLHSLVALTLDNILIFPFAIAYLLVSHIVSDRMYDYSSIRLDLILSTSGIVTALPLLWYSLAAQKLSLKTLGFLHYISPSMQLALGVLLYNEEFKSTQQVSFIIIWVAVIVFIADGIVDHRRNSTTPIELEI